jgi:integrase
MNQRTKVLTLPSIEKTEPKSVEANQKAVDKLPFNSGTWRVEGIPGLYVRCRASCKSFFIQRRRDGVLVKETLGPMTVKRAKEKAMKSWSLMKAPPDGVTFEVALERLIAEKKLAPKTIHNYRYNGDRYLSHWKSRTLDEIGNDRAGMRRLQHDVSRNHGAAAANQVVRLVSAVYRWQRKIDPNLPEPPTVATPVHRIAARDWAYSDDELKKWWHSVEEKDGRRVELGVRTVTPVKKMWWLTVLFTGARKGSVEALQWSDIDFERKVIRFSVTKGDRPYAVPLADKLAGLLTDYRGSGDVPPSEWVFPSSVKDGAHVADVKNTRDGVGPAHRLRHSFRTTLANLCATPDQARLLMGHSMGGDVSRGYITTPLLLESLRPIANAVAQHYARIIGL